MIRFSRRMGPNEELTTSLGGKTVIITGGGRGIGRELAKALLKLNAKVIIACRDVEAGEKAANEVVEELNVPRHLLKVKHIDLVSLRTVKSFAEEVIAEEQNLHILVNNAGVPGSKDLVITEDGFEMAYQTNYLSHVYLTDLLMPLLKKSAPSRIVNVASKAYLFGWIGNNIETSFKTRTTTALARYSETKKAQMIWTNALASELEGTGVTINCCHPGIVQTEFNTADAWSFSKISTRLLITFFGRPVEAGIKTQLQICLMENPPNGKYFAGRTPRSTMIDGHQIWNVKFLQETRRIIEETIAANHSQ